MRESAPKLAFRDCFAGIGLASRALEAAARDPEPAGAHHVPHRVLLGDILRSASAASAVMTIGQQFHKLLVAKFPVRLWSVYACTYSMCTWV